MESFSGRPGCHARCAPGRVLTTDTAFFLDAAGFYF
jgi:hypothetical protein